MANFNSFRLYFLRLDGEVECSISNPIVAIEEETGRFSPRRLEPDKAWRHEQCFDSGNDLNNFLIQRERYFIDHDKLFRDQERYGIDPYYEFVALAEDSDTGIQPGLPSLGGWQRHRAFHFCIEDRLLDFRSKLLLAAEFAAVCRAPFCNLRSSCPFDTDADIDKAVANVRYGRKHRWIGMRPELPANTPWFYREAQRWQHTRQSECQFMREPRYARRCERAGECNCIDTAKNFRQIERR